MSNFVLPNYNHFECSEGPKFGAVELKEFIIRWEYNGEGKILLSLNDKEDILIQSVEHVKTKI